MTELKLCINCKHYSYSIYVDSYAKCKHPSVASPVNGVADSFCDIERKHGCGWLAVNFEPKNYD
jgi:hypothetical protein